MEKSLEKLEKLGIAREDNTIREGQNNIVEEILAQKHEEKSERGL